MYVIKRDGRREAVHFDKITARIVKLCFGLSPLVEPVLVAQKARPLLLPCVPLRQRCQRGHNARSAPQVCTGVYRGVTTSELDELAAETAAHLTTEHRASLCVALPAGCMCLRRTWMRARACRFTQERARVWVGG